MPPLYSSAFTVSTIGRAAIEARTDPGKTLQANHHYLVQLERSRDFDAVRS